MDKNTIWAIVLSTLVIVGSYFLIPKVFGVNKAKDAQQTSVEVVADDSVPLTPAAWILIAASALVLIAGIVIAFKARSVSI